MITEPSQQQPYLARQNVMIATPCYGGMVHEAYMRGLTNLVAASMQINMGMNMATIVNESLVTRARNELVKYLMMTDCTHLFFIDADIDFKAEHVLRALLHDKDIVVGAYPLKRVVWEGIDTSIAKTVEAVKRQATDYVINIRFANDQQRETGHVPIIDGLMEVHDAGTGFMCIKRSVIEQMIDAYPETHYAKEPKTVNKPGDDGKRWALFDTMIDEDNRYLSEDYTFCRRWQKLGGKIMLDPQIVLGHVGTFSFEGHQVFDIVEDPRQPTQPVRPQGLLGG